MDRVHAPRAARRGLRWAGAALAAVALAAGVTIGSANAGVAGVVITTAARQAPALWPAAAPSGTASTQVDGPNGPLTLTANPAKGLPPAGAQVTVRGSGFDTDELWVAVCQDDGVAPIALTHCLGGPIPDFNGSASWGVITADGTAPFAGPVAGKWRGGGSFTITLQLLSASGQDADCLAESCSIYVRSADDADRSADARVPLSFAAPTVTTSSRASTTTVGAVATTVSPDMVLQTSIPAGDEQTIVFTGFTPKEKVDVTLYSDPIELPTVRADSAGAVTITFDVPPDLAPGDHLIQAVGRQSGRVGIAQFAVGEAQVTTTTDLTSPTETVAPDETAETVMTLPTTGLDIGGVAQSASDDVQSTAESAEPGLGVTDDAAGDAAGEQTASGPAAGTAGSSRALWLWLAIIVVVLIAVITGALVLWRRRGDRGAELPAAPVAVLDDGDAGTGSWPLTFGGSGGYGGETGPAHGTDYGTGDQAAAPGWTDWAAGGYEPVDPGGADAGPATEQWQPHWQPQAAEPQPQAPEPLLQQPPAPQPQQPPEDEAPPRQGRHHRPD